MSTPTMPVADAVQSSGLPWSLWKAQVTGLLRLEVKKYLLSKRAFVLYFLAFMPWFPLFLWNLLPFLGEDLPPIQEASMIFATFVFQGYLHLLIFFGCIVTFTNLFRGEVLEHCLHYYFLCPVRREVLVVGKYVAGQFATWIIFATGVLVSTILLYFPFGGAALEYFVSGPGFGHLLAYLGVTVLAIIGYGAVFLFTGLLFRNPIIPAAVIILWESINSFLPAVLKKISVIHYLVSLCPVPPRGQLFAVGVDPVSAWFSVPGLLLVTCGVLVLACLKIRGMEISYGGE